MNTSRTMFGKHKQGHIFPLLMNSNSTEQCFVGVMQRLSNTDEFIWFYSKSHIIAGASQDTIAMFGVSVVVDKVRVRTSNYFECCVCCVGRWKQRILMRIT